VTDVVVERSVLTEINEDVMLCYVRCASDQVYDSNKYLSVFIVAMVFNAFGSVPIYVFGVTYIDDASPHGTASVHLGIYNYL